MVENATETTSGWVGRPWAARLVRAVVFLVPMVVSIGVAFALSRVFPTPGRFTLRVVRWIAIASASTVVLVVVDKVARRLLPLATLFGLTLAFPDQAPSRFKLALRTGSLGQLRARVADARAGGLGDTPAEAAERVLELVVALGAHDRLTRGHSERVRAYTQMIGEEMGIDGVALDRLRWSGLLHDIGKLLISSQILNKPGTLTRDEFEIIKQHPNLGRELVAPLTEWLGDAARAVWEHHERWDGQGYPSGLSGTNISLAARIVSVADAYDVMTSARSYKKPVSPAQARADMTRCSGTQFDPAVVRAFMNLSLGRLRFAMGPLSWLAQVPMFPQAVAASAAQGTATAATAIVGAAAASVGLGIAPDAAAADSAPAIIEALEASIRPVDRTMSLETSTTTSIVVTVESTLPRDLDDLALDGSATTTTTAAGDVVVAEPVPVPPEPPSATEPPAPPPAITTTVPSAGPENTTTVAVPVTSEPPPTPTPPTPTPPTPTIVPATTVATATTTAPAVPIDVTVLFLSNQAADPVAAGDLSLAVDPPAIPALEDFDGDGAPGLGISRGRLGLDDTDPGSNRRFVAAFGQPARLRGDVQLRLGVAANDFSGNAVHVAVGLYHCGPAECAPIGTIDRWVPKANRFRNVVAGFGPQSIELAADEWIELRVANLGDSEDDIELAYGASDYPSRITVG